MSVLARRHLLLRGLVALLLLAWAVAALAGQSPFLGVDGDIYLGATRSWWTGGDLYGWTHENGFGFTYPPLAAAAFVPLALVPGHGGVLVLQLASAAALVGSVVLVCRRLDVRPEIPLLLALIWYPAVRSVGSGQIDAILLLLVLVDLLVLPARWRGVLIGLAAGVKLTPLAALLYLAVRKDVPSMLRVVATFLGAAAVGWMLAPGASATYWSGLVESTERVGDPGAALNQSLLALSVRVVGQAGVDPSPTVTAVWLVLVLVAVAVAAAVMRSRLRRGDELAAVAVAVSVGLLVSPISWMHHWVGAVPLLIVMGVRAVRHRDAWLGVGAVVGYAALAVPSWWVLGSARGWGLPASVLGSAAVVWTPLAWGLLARRADAGSRLLD